MKFLSIILTYAVLSITAAQGATTYYLDSQGGLDSRAGTSAATAWQTLAKINATTLQPGDSVLFKCGGVWTGQFVPIGSGTAGNLIVISKYGTGSMPRINGNGAAWTVRLVNQEYITLSDLEITDSAALDQSNRMGIFMDHTIAMVSRQVTLRNLYIHDISGRSNGASWIWWKSGAIRIQKSHNGSGYNGLLIEGNMIRKIRGQGIILYEGGGVPGVDNNATRSYNVVIRNNMLDTIGGDGIVLHGTNHGLVEHNTMRFGGWGVDGCCAGMWGGSYNDSAVFQFNEVYNFDRSNGYCDRTAFDCDINERNQFVQYNYSHDNGGGFMLWCCNNGSSSGTTVRYNISQNDRTNIFSIMADISTFKVYNNVFYQKAGQNVTMGGAGGPGVFRNNIIINNGMNAFEVWGNNNIYWGNTAAVGTGNTKVDPRLVNPGSGGTGLNTVDGYKLQAGSPAIGQALRIAGMGTQDYFGGQLPATGALDIGAHQRDASSVAEWPAPAYAEEEISFQAGPNPFPQATVISFRQPQPRAIPGANQYARVSVYSIRGGLVETLLNGIVAPGRHDLTWNAAARPSGIYVVRLQMGKRMMEKRIVLSR